jgi:flagellar hook-associated protein 1 FlgK
MSLLGLFDIGRSGVYANQKALRVASNNIANVNTPGYSRQDVIMEIANPVQLHGEFLGRGVGEVNIRRHFDSFTFLQIIGQSASYGKSFSLDRGLSHIEQIFNEVQELGLLNTMEDYFNTWQEVATNPEGVAQRSTLLMKAEAFVNVVKQMESDIKNTLKFVNDEIGDSINQINVLTQNIATLNEKIIEVEAGGAETAHVFRDQREQIMKELAELVDYDWYESSDGTVTIVAGRGSIVAGVESFQLSTAMNLEGDREIFKSGVNLTSFFQSGQIGGYIALRNDIKTNTLYSLRKLVASITKETNVLHYDYGYDLDGNTNNNFFSPLQVLTLDTTSGGTSSASISAAIPVATRNNVTLDEYDLVFIDASNFELRNHQTGAVVVPQGTYTHTAPGPTTFTYNGIQVTINGTTAANDSFFISPIENAVENFSVALTEGRQVAAAQSAATVPGDNTNALDIVDMYGSPISNLNDVTYEDYYAEIVSTVGSLSHAASDSLEFEGNLLFELQNRRESISGVSLDEEAANIIRYQRAFEAGARIIKLTDELLEIIINI